MSGTFLCVSKKIGFKSCPGPCVSFCKRFLTQKSQLFFHLGFLFLPEVENALHLIEKKDIKPDIGTFHSLSLGSQPTDLRFC